MPESAEAHRPAAPRGLRPYLLIPAAALVAVLPLILHGPSCGHDFDFHILNWLEAAAQFRHGNLHPRWAVSPAWNAGEPRLLFYPPLSWTLGALLGLLLTPFRNGWTAAPILYTWICLTASGLTLHRLARAFAGPTAATLAATLYLANPYMLFTAYERTAYGELLAAAWLPLLFLSILRPRPTASGIAIPVALLWLTNAPAAVMGTYTLAVLAAIRLAIPFPAAPQPIPTPQQRNWRSGRTDRTRVALTTAAGTILGLALAAFYILPAATERRYVQITMAILPGLRIDDNTLFHHTGFTPDAIAHDAVLHTASLLAVILLAATAAAFAPLPLGCHSRSGSATAVDPLVVIPEGNLLLKRGPHLRRRAPAFLSVIPAGNLLLELLPNPTLPLAILTILMALLLTPATLPLWHHLPELAFLQFPWRLLAIQAAVLSLAAALAIRHLTLTPAILALVTLALAATLTLPAATAFRQECDDEDTVAARQTLFATHQGTDPTDEYTPTTADNDVLNHRDPPFWLSPDPNAPPPPTPAPAPAPRDFTVDAPAPETLILNLRRYPNWHIQLNGGETSEDVRDDGLATVPVPAGQTRVHLTFRTTPIEYTGEAVSALALCILAFIPRARRTLS